MSGYRIYNKHGRNVLNTKADLATLRDLKNLGWGCRGCAVVKQLQCQTRYIDS